MVISSTPLPPITIDAEVRTNFFELGLQDCSEIEILNSLYIEDCDPGFIQLQGAPGSLIRLFVASYAYTAPSVWPGNEYDYILEISGLAPGTVSTSQQSWGSLKALYR